MGDYGLEVGTGGRRDRQNPASRLNSRPDHRFIAVVGEPWPKLRRTTRAIGIGLA